MFHIWRKPNFLYFLTRKFFFTHTKTLKERFYGRLSTNLIFRADSYATLVAIIVVMEPDNRCPGPMGSVVFYYQYRLGLVSLIFQFLNRRLKLRFFERFTGIHQNFSPVRFVIFQISTWDFVFISINFQKSKFQTLFDNPLRKIPNVI